ncbi:C-4 sterol methyl oxidase [Thecamonas trahens ATCC 50062]|uniref:C-4 sterol methyl oxidase n=1 Tax=Thecamonas trahens ATCC 50062 TaxID=461836 RepID=A0A0L0DDI8_THETB|nr:C-4 sterol methyl oxidase [Thecamonas trahens ATCC 50062]KNC50384.1 C-4 sterol methyl oxidase [Thecamonas trahens ATCC 50062]|eukprot:XP_013756926.1 C-4 sterol methyl oxidase [Thecamonas trahens ATCC 50062]
MGKDDAFRSPWVWGPVLLGVVGVPVVAFAAAGVRVAGHGPELKLPFPSAVASLCLPSALSGACTYPAAAYAFVGMLLFYIGFSTVLQLAFYTAAAKQETREARAAAASAWRTAGAADASSFIVDTPEDCMVWWLPARAAAFASKRRIAQHPVFASVNLLTSALAAAGLVHIVVAGASYMVWPWDSARSQAYGLAVGTTAAVLSEQLAQYLWHRVMHIPWFYATFHKFHHKARNPSAFDDLLIHPLEAIGFYLILFAPPVLFSIHIFGFLAYFAMHGVSGVLDHSGITVRLGSWYSTVDHDLHHKLVTANYATPLMYWDRIFGTYVGEHHPAGRAHIARALTPAAAASRNLASTPSSSPRTSLPRSATALAGAFASRDMLVLDKVLTALRVNAYSARAERVALNSKYQQQKGSTEPEFAEKKLHRELARVSLASCLVVVAGDYEPKPSDRLKGQGRVSIADIVASFIAKGDPKLSTKLPEWQRRPVSWKSSIIELAQARAALQRPPVPY